jgi:hypothetical protein
MSVLVLCGASAGLAVADGLKGVVDARRNVLVPLERGLVHRLD